MREVAVELIDAFVDGGAGGNVAGVVLDGAADLSPQQRQEVARLAGVSETAFILPSASAHLRLEFYTPTRSIPHCGHATVATLARLAELGRLTGEELVHETIDGPRRVRIEGKRVFLEQMPARLAPLEEAAVHQILVSIGLTRGDLLSHTLPFLADNGNRSIQIGVRNAQVLRSLRPNMNGICEMTNRFGAVCYYAFALDSVVVGRDATSRMFGPAYGIPEESATGMAAGPLACWLDARGGGRDSLIIEQGQMMNPPSPSLIVARPERSGAVLTTMWVGGSARAKGVRQIAIP